MAGCALLEMHGLAQQGDQDPWRDDQVSAGQQDGATSEATRVSSQHEVPTAVGKSIDA